MTTKTYYAKSILASKTFWVNLAILLVALANETEFAVFIPDFVGEYLLAFAGVINLVLRVYSVRPIAFIGATEVKPVEVATLYKAGAPPKNAA